MPGAPLVHVLQYAGGIVPCGHFRAFFYCGVGQVIAVVAKGSPDVEPQSLTVGTVATGVRIGGDLPLPPWGRRFAARLSADVLVTPGDVAIRLLNSMPTNASTSPFAWSIPRLTVALGAGIVTDLHLK